jgi:hypothetical protein
LRRATGPGWALVGDAGYFKDPLTAHGITDALRDAEFLTQRWSTVVRTHSMSTSERGTGSRCRCLTSRSRSRPTNGTSGEIRELLLAESAAMKPEIAALRALDTPASAEAA